MFTAVEEGGVHMHVYSGGGGGGYTCMFTAVEEGGGALGAHGPSSS